MKDDKLLREVLQRKIAQLKQEKAQAAPKDIAKVMTNRFKISQGRTMDILTGREPLETMTYNMLYKLMVAVQAVIKEKYTNLDLYDLNTDTYFTEIEIKEFEKPVKKREEDFDIIIKEWKQTNIGMYSYITIFTDINEVIKWRDYNKLRYNPETQRDLIIIETDGVPIYKIDRNVDAINEIKKSMFNGSYFPVPGTLNINPELYDEYPIKIRNNNLIIEEKFKIDLIEGFHNYQAYTEIKDKNPDWEYPCEFRLYLLNIEDANRYILQMDKKNHFKETQTARIDTLNGANYFVNTLNTTSGFNLHGSIDNNMFLYLYIILPKLFKIDNIKDGAKLLSSTIKKLNYIIMKMDHFEEAFNKEEWFIYLYIIKYCNENNLDFEKVFELIQIDEVFNEIEIKNEPLNKHYNFLNSVLNEVIKNV